MRKYDVVRGERRRAQLVMVVAVLALVAGRICEVTSREGDTAFCSANDRSRWCTIASLVEHGTYAIDDVISIQGDQPNRRPWDSIDKVRHVGADGQLHFYSSKPTLLPTMVAGIYYVVNKMSGLKMTEHPIYVPRLILLLLNLPVLAVLLLSMLASIEMVGASDFARRLAMAAICFGTMTTPFAISLNNHLIAASATSLTLMIYLFVSERRRDDILGPVFHPRVLPWAAAGLSAAFAVANELPALSMFVLWLGLFTAMVRRSFLPFMMASLTVAIGVFGTNWVAHQSWATPYAHRGIGEAIETLVVNEVSLESDLPPWGSDAPYQRLQGPLREQLNQSESIDNTDTVDARRLRSSGYELIVRQDRQQTDGTGSSVTSQFHLAESADADAIRWTLSQWNDWYDYPGSHWRKETRPGVDAGEPNRMRYVFHATFGYYGLFSLTPLWILVPIGWATGIRHGPAETRRLVAAIAITSVVVFAFYIARPEIDRNYGGVSVCLRWMIWLAPLWLFCIVDEMSALAESRAGRAILLVLFALGVFSVATSLDTPWQSPWPMRFASFLGWLG